MKTKIFLMLFFIFIYGFSQSYKIKKISDKRYVFPLLYNNYENDSTSLEHCENDWYYRIIDTTKLITDTLQIKEMDGGYLIYLDDVNIIKLINYSTSATYLILPDKNKVKLDFYIIPPYLTGAYLLNLNEFGKVLALESYLVGNSGLSANIINVSLIFLDKNFKVLSYNSFNGGINLLFVNSNKFLLNIYDYNGIDNNGNIKYCLNIFELTKDSFKRTDSPPECYIYRDDNQLKNYDRCNCSTLYKPFVSFRE